MSRSLLVVVSLILAYGATAHAAFTSEICLAKKRQAQGKLLKCRAIEDAKALLGKPADLAKCETKFQEKLAKLSEKATEAEIRAASSTTATRSRITTPD